MPNRLAAIAFLVIAVALLTGCGSSSDEESTATDRGAAPAAGAPAGAGAESCETFAADATSLRATGLGCEQARQVMYGWQRQSACALPAASARGGCSVRAYRCQAVRAERGVAVSCARPGASLAFVDRRG